MLSKICKKCLLRYGNYGSDIALLELDGNVDLNSFFLPACIDWHLDDITSHLSHTNLGYVAGMGVSEDNMFSDRLKMTTLPVASDEKCMEKQAQDFRKYLTFTTFCAGWENGTGVCNGDSGSGTSDHFHPFNLSSNSHLLHMLKKV